METTHRLAQPTDAAAIARLHIDVQRRHYVGILPQVFLDGLSQETVEAIWRSALTGEAGEQVILVAEETAGSIVGFAAAAAGTGDVHALYVDVALQSHGVGTQLLRAVAEGLVEHAQTEMWCVVYAKNEQARTFYQRRGGVEELHSSGRISGVWVEQVAYRWNDVRTSLLATGESGET